MLLYPTGTSSTAAQPLLPYYPTTLVVHFSPRTKVTLLFLAVTLTLLFRYVIDCGRHKENRYEPRRKMEMLVEDFASQAYKPTYYYKVTIYSLLASPRRKLTIHLPCSYHAHTICVPTRPTYSNVGAAPAACGRASPSTSSPRTASPCTLTSK